MNRVMALLSAVLVIAASVGVYSYTAMPTHQRTSDVILIKNGSVYNFIGFRNFTFTIPGGKFNTNGNGTWISNNSVAQFATPTGLTVTWQLPPKKLPDPSFYNVTSPPWTWAKSGALNFSVFWYSHDSLHQTVSFIFFSPVYVSVKFTSPFEIHYSA